MIMPTLLLHKSSWFVILSCLIHLLLENLNQFVISIIPRHTQLTICYCKSHYCTKAAGLSFDLLIIRNFEPVCDCYDLNTHMLQYIIANHAIAQKLLVYYLVFFDSLLIEPICDKYYFSTFVLKLIIADFY